MSESLLKEHDVHSMNVEELSDFLESKGIEEADTAEFVSKLLHITFICFVLYATFMVCVCVMCII